MKVIVVSPAVPHPFGDTAARWLYVLVAGLLQRGARVACLVASEEPSSRVREARERLAGLAGGGHLDLEVFPLAVRPVLWRKLRSLRRPFSEVLHAIGLRAALERQAAGGYDVLHLEQLWTGWLGAGRARTLLNVHHFEVIDWEGRRAVGLGERKALFQMRRATRRILRDARHVRLFTPRLLDRARQLNDRANYWVIPSALDVSLYPLQPMVREPVVGLLGSMHWLPSRTAAERLITSVWPRVRRRVPAARLLVGGWNARRYLQHYAAPDISLVENLPHPSDFFAQVAVLAYPPARGSGMKIKVLESMAYGVPVVTTTEGVEGLDYQDGVHGWVRDDDEALADRIVELLGDAGQRTRMREAARALVEERYSPTPVLTQLLGAYERVGRE